MESQNRYDAGASIFSFDFGLNFSLKGCVYYGFVIRLEPLSNPD